MRGLRFRVTWNKEGTWMEVNWGMKVTGREGRDPAVVKRGHRGGGLAPGEQILGSSGVIQESPPEGGT